MIEKRTRDVFYAPSARRHYFTKRAAIHAEASARIKAKYPTEEPEHDDTGRVTLSGWHWATDERLQRLHARFVARLTRAYRDANNLAGEVE